MAGHYAFAKERPRDLRGLYDLLSRLEDRGARLNLISSAGSPSPQAREDWLYAWHEVSSWAEIVLSRYVPDKAKGLTLSVHAKPDWTERLYFGAHYARAQGLRRLVSVWADEIELFAEPDPGFVLVDPDTPFSSWMKVQEVLTAAVVEVWVTDPYLAAAALSVFLSVPAAASLRLLTAEGCAPSVSAWQRFCTERGGQSEMRTATRQGLSHDRFFGVDGRTFLSGASLKDIGNRLSVLMEIHDADTAGRIRSRFDTAWAVGTVV